MEYSYSFQQFNRHQMLHLFWLHMVRLITTIPLFGYPAHYYLLSLCLNTTIFISFFVTRAPLFQTCFVEHQGTNQQNALAMIRRHCAMMVWVSHLFQSCTLLPSFTDLRNLEIIYGQALVWKQVFIHTLAFLTTVFLQSTYG